MSWLQWIGLQLLLFFLVGKIVEFVYLQREYGDVSIVVYDHYKDQDVQFISDVLSLRENVFFSVNNIKKPLEDKGLISVSKHINDDRYVYVIYNSTFPEDVTKMLKDREYDIFESPNLSVARNKRGRYRLHIITHGSNIIAMKPIIAFDEQTLLPPLHKRFPPISSSQISSYIFRHEVSEETYNEFISNITLSS